MLKMTELINVYVKAEQEMERHAVAMKSLDERASKAGALAVHEQSDGIVMQVNSKGYDDLARYGLENVQGGRSSGKYTHVHFESNGMRFCYCEAD